MEGIANTPRPLSQQALLRLIHTSLLSTVLLTQPPWSWTELANLLCHKSIHKAGCLECIIEKHMKPENRTVVQSVCDNTNPDPPPSQWCLPLAHGEFRAANILRADGETIRVYWIERQGNITDTSGMLRGNASQTAKVPMKLNAEHPFPISEVPETQSIPTTPVRKTPRPQSNSHSKSGRAPFRSPMINRLNAEGGGQSSPKRALSGTSNLSASSPMSRKLFSSPVRTVVFEHAKSHFTPFKSPMRVNKKDVNILKEVNSQTPAASQTVFFASKAKDAAKATDATKIRDSHTNINCCADADFSTGQVSMSLSIPALKLKKRELEKKIKKKEDMLSRLEFGRSILQNNNATTFEALINKWRTAAQATAERLFEKVEPAMRSAAQLKESGLSSGFPSWGYDDDKEILKRRRMDPEHCYQSEGEIDELRMGYEPDLPVEDDEVSIASMLKKMGVDLELIRYDPKEDRFQTGG